MPRAVRLAIPHGAHAGERLSPATVRVLKVTDGLAIRLEEEMIVIDLACTLEFRAQCQLTLQDGQRTRTQLDPPILAGLGRILVAAIDACLLDRECPACRIEVGHRERNLFRRSQAREEPKFIVVALRFAPVAVKRRNERLRLVNREWIDDGPILALDARALELARGIVQFGVITVAELEGAAQDAEGVVVRLLAPVCTVRDFDERGISNVEKSKLAKMRAPDSPFSTRRNEFTVTAAMSFFDILAVQCVRKSSNTWLQVRGDPARGTLFRWT